MYSGCLRCCSLGLIRGSPGGRDELGPGVGEVDGISETYGVFSMMDVPVAMLPLEVVLLRELLLLLDALVSYQPLWGSLNPDVLVVPWNVVEGNSI